MSPDCRDRDPGVPSERVADHGDVEQVPPGARTTSSKPTHATGARPSVPSTRKQKRYAGSELLGPPCAQAPGTQVQRAGRHPSTKHGQSAEKTGVLWPWGRAFSLVPSGSGTACPEASTCSNFAILCIALSLAIDVETQAPSWPRGAGASRGHRERERETSLVCLDVVVPQDRGCSSPRSDSTHGAADEVIVGERRHVTHPPLRTAGAAYKFSAQA